MPRDPREYITVVATMPEHGKVEGLSDAAFRLIIELWCWSKRGKTDGDVPWPVWQRRRTPRVRAELVDAGLVEVDGQKVTLHDYAEHQWTEAEAAERSAKRAEAGRLGGLAKAANQAGKPVANASDQVASAMASAVANPGNALAEEKRREEKRQDPPQPPAGGAAAEPLREATPDPILEEFERFYQAYPRKIGRGPALKAYRAARRKVDRDVIAEAFHPFVAAMQHRDVDKIPHPSTWLNREPWHDDPDAIATPLAIAGVDWDAERQWAAEQDRLAEQETAR